MGVLETRDKIGGRTCDATTPSYARSAPGGTGLAAPLTGCERFPASRQAGRFGPARSEPSERRNKVGASKAKVGAVSATVIVLVLVSALLHAAWSASIKGSPSPLAFNVTQTLVTVP